MVRPPDLPSDATYVAGGKVGGWWQQCKSIDDYKAVHCRIWNGVGLILEDEEFLFYDGGAPPQDAELKISAAPAFPGPDRVYLTDGRVLLPRSRFDELKLFIDWLEGKRNAPR